MKHLDSGFGLRASGIGILSVFGFRFSEFNAR